MKPVRIAVVGSLNYDLQAFVPRLPRPGESISTLDLRRGLGGKGFNQAVAARRLGAAVAMVGTVGDDDSGREFEARLDELGIDRGAVRRGQARTGLAQVMVDERGENAIVITAGANAELAPRALDAKQLQADVLLVQGELRPDTTVRALELAAGIKILNCAPASLDLVPGAALADVVVANQLEAAEMGGVDRLHEVGAGAVVVTLGRRGALIDNTVIPAPRIEAVDTTGAGDAFCGALAVALAEGRELEAAVAWANRAGAAAALRVGASSAMPTREELEAVS